MTGFLIKRIVSAAIVLLAFSFVVFFLIQLPPGDFADAWGRR